MEGVALESVAKIFRHRPVLFNWLGKESKREVRALDGVTLNAPAGQVLVLLGPNGSGKTSLLKLVSTMLLPDAGRVLVAGWDTLRDSSEVRRHVGFALATDRSFFPRLTARENLEVFAALEDVPRRVRPQRVEAALNDTGLTEAADTLVMKFSSGMHNRLGIARALLKQPSVLLLDEPTRSLDPAAAIRLWQLVRETAALGCSVVLATHNFDEAVSVGHAVAVLNRGRVVAHSAITVQTSIKDLRATYFREIDVPSDSKHEPNGAL